MRNLKPPPLIIAHPGRMSLTWKSQHAKDTASHGPSATALPPRPDPRAQWRRGQYASQTEKATAVAPAEEPCGWMQTRADVCNDIIHNRRYKAR